MLQIRDKGVIYLYQLMAEWFRQFVRILYSRNFAHAKFRENKNLAKISKFTVCNCNISEPNTIKFQ